MYWEQFLKHNGHRLALVLLAVFMVASVSSGQILSGWGTPTIDGVLEGGGPGGEPLSPAAIIALQTEVEARIADKTVKAKDVKLLVRSLEDALKRIDQGKLKQAEDEIEKFLKEVKKLVKKGDVPVALGDQWTAAANNIINPPPGGGEWANAGSVTFPLLGGGVDGTLYVLNDADNIYFAFAVPIGSFDPLNLVALRIDLASNDDVVYVGNDLPFIDGSAFPPGVCDSSPYKVPCFQFDADQHGIGAYSADATTFVFEMSHPLNSGDSFDMAISAGQQVGYRIGFFGAANFDLYETWYPVETEFGTIQTAAGPNAYLAGSGLERGGNLAELETENKSTLGPNYPNPFNPSTTITYEIQTPSEVTLKVFNMLGQEVSTLVNRYQSAGKYSVTFEAGNLPSGLYVYQLRAGSKVANRTMVLVK
ncbi:MAG: T9SS type A sorting domain-containing protein [Ignavibacteria bacterium]|nr:T9SS type A sorting domain-containing protein [Ignavibacteria bacterium]